MTEHIVVFITASNEEEAARIAEGILDARLAACATILRNVRSLYWWRGKKEDASEVLMVVKTRRHLFGALAAEVKKLHSYSVPEILALPIIDGSAEYLAWLEGETRTG